MAIDYSGLQRIKPLRRGLAEEASVQPMSPVELLEPLQQSLRQAAMQQPPSAPASHIRFSTSDPEDLQDYNPETSPYQAATVSEGFGTSFNTTGTRGNVSMTGGSNPDEAYRRYLDNMGALDERTAEQAEVAKNEAYTQAYQAGRFPEHAGRGGTIAINTVDAEGKPITKIMSRNEASGQTFEKPLPFAMQAQAKSFQRAQPVVNAIGELSEKINTLQGVAAKLASPAERAKAQLNLNDDLAEYQSLVFGFTPIIARAVGHVGALTEQDVQSVRSLFPGPGDSKSLRDRKMIRLQSILNQVGEVSSEPMAALGGGTAQSPAQSETQQQSAFKVRRRLS